MNYQLYEKNIGLLNLHENNLNLVILISIKDSKFGDSEKTKWKHNYLLKCYLHYNREVEIFMLTYPGSIITDDHFSSLTIHWALMLNLVY